MENKVLKSPEAEEVIKALSVYVAAGKEFDKLLDLKKEKLSRAIYQSPSFDGPGGGKQNGLKPDKMANAMAGIERIDKKLCKIAGSFQTLIEQVQSIIDNLKPDYNLMIIMEWRYINGEDWTKISKVTGFSMSHCFLLHNKAIVALCEKGIYSKKCL
jgi:hypothetical protein